MITNQQMIFCDEYLLNGFNATKAAITAKYSKKTAAEQGSRLLTNVKISDYIKERTEKASNERIMTIIELKEFWSSVARGEETEDMKDRLKGSELLGKSEACFTENNNTTIKFPQGVDINFVTPESES